MQYMLSHDGFLELNPADRQSTWTAVPGWTKDRNLEVPCTWIFSLLCVLVFETLS